MTDHERRMQALREAATRLDRLPDPPRQRFVGHYMPGVLVVSPDMQLTPDYFQSTTEWRLADESPRAESFTDWLARSADLLEACAKRRRGPNEV